MTNQWQRWHGIMKAVPFEEKRLAKWEPPYIVQPKYDGIRCRAVPVQDSYVLLSSEENILYSAPHILDWLSKTQMNVELDGELYCHGMSFEQITSITSRTVNLHPDHKAIKFHVFDLVNGDPQMKRLNDLYDVFYSLPRDRFELAPFWICYNLDCIMKVFDEIINLGYEGIIVRHKMAMYERKRSTWVMKFKPKKEDEYEIIGVQEEISKDGIPKGSLGALTCKSGDGGVFNIGTGYTEGDRQDMWLARENLIGKQAKVKYQHLTTGKKVPRFPVFVEVI